jgi:hypothetical protein
LNGSERRNFHQCSRADDRRESSVSVSTPSGTEAPDDLAMHDGWAQVSFTDIVGWTDICAMQENEQAIPVRYEVNLHMKSMPSGIESIHKTEYN